MPGINLIGFFTANMGLGVYARTIGELLLAKNIKFCILNVSTSPGKVAKEDDWSKFKPYFSSTPLYDINLYIFGADFAQLIYPKIKDTVQSKNKYNVYIPFWELYEYSDTFIALKNEMHMFLAPSRFIQYSLMRVIDNAYIDYIPPGLVMGKVKLEEKAGKFRFFYNFDITSSMPRKNPRVLISAFNQLFSTDDSVELVLKVNGTANPAFKPVADYLYQITRAKNIKVIDESLTYQQMVELIASADCYVSCHRSEGIGLGLFEAMSLGVPCIATGYGGNTEFMNNGNSVLLRYDLEETQCKQYQSLSNKPDTWAGVRKTELLNAMLKMRRDENFRKMVGENAKKDIQQRMNEFWNTRALESVINTYTLFRGRNHLSSSASM